jgi:hypothetical protein
MPDLTVSLTDAQWTRVVAASGAFKNTGEVTEAEVTAILKKRLAATVSDYELQHATPTDF